MWQSAPPAGGSAEAQTSTARECLRAHTGAVLRDLTSYRRAVFACASKKRLRENDPCKKDRVQNRALTPSWRSELAERLRGQHRYTLLQRRNCSSKCRIFARKKASLVHGCTCTGYSRTHKGKKCAPASELMLLSKVCWRCCARAAKYQPATITKRKGGGWLQGWHRVA